MRTWVSEAVEQELLFRWAALMSPQYPELELMFHIPNGGKRNASEAAHLKRQGVKAGVPDVCLPVPRGKYHGMYIEMKAGKNRATEKQKEWIERLMNQGYKVCICYGWADASDRIKEYLEEGKGEK